MNPGFPHIKIIVTAGPTREPIDPVRYLSNRSTGKMGYEIAEEAARRGADVFLVSGPSPLRASGKVKLSRVETAFEMKRELEKLLPGADCIVMAAAVADFRVKDVSVKKIKKTAGLTLELVENPDILGGLAGQKDILRVGFALETENPVINGTRKLKSKDLDLIVINAHGGEQGAFGETRNDYIIIERDGSREDIKGAAKERVAGSILDKIGGMYDKKSHKER